MLREADEVPPVLLQEGNCIPLALSRLLGKAKDIARVIEDLQNQSGGDASSLLHSRTYRESHQLFGAHLRPVLKVTLHHTESMWLVHCEKAGVPHCVALKIHADGKSTVWDGRRRMVISTRSLQGVIVYATIVHSLYHQGRC